VPAENVDDTDWALERIEFIGHALRIKSGWCRWDQNWRFGWRVPYWERPSVMWLAKWIYVLTELLVQALYTYKCVICVAMDRRRDMWADGYTIEVAHWGFSGWTSMNFYGTAYDFWVLAVGHGWRDWHYDVYETSTV
jgi:hypothetical protein